MTNFDTAPAERNPRLEQAHKHSSRHRTEISDSDECGCFHCLEVFDPAEILDWVDDETTALCPKCGIDSVLGSRSGFPLNRDFVTEMKSYWFDRTVLIRRGESDDQGEEDALRRFFGTD